ncbi:hypothetical protein [Sediminibacterium soli]|uniref:hypothetical protein n=1 Tax=Sediminibacterium soli TaxID=2698829 RepID=UPI0013799443|nr:hypothetical protein [Sediminibacterium soli]NCI46270.1 hypothetical protein [Sediminibacterium soli]
MRISKKLIAYFFLPAIASCSREFEPIDYGKEACANCRMTIVDNRFAAEFIDKKGKVFKFDDLLCLKRYAAAHPDNIPDLVFIEDYLGKQNQPLDAIKAFYLQHEFFNSPMKGNYAAFGTLTETGRLKDSLAISPMTWNNLK